MIVAYSPQFALVVVAALQQQGWTLRPTTEPEEMLLADTADVVITSPLEYASSPCMDYALVPQFGIMTGGFAGMLKLIFNQGLTSINTIAVKQPHGFAALVARIVLLESMTSPHGLSPFLPMPAFRKCLPPPMPHCLPATTQCLMEAASAQCLTFPTSGRIWPRHSSLPCCWGRVGKLSDAQLQEFAAAAEQARAGHSRCRSTKRTQHWPGVSTSGICVGTFGTACAREDLPALNTLYRYLFYHGISRICPR
ncbi:MAG: hypothetical protein IPM61_16455 [Chlorobi bacterium]|nr:hypothetical protein [Chlorobiota bacterium]